MPEEKTQPKRRFPEGIKPDVSRLVVQRYGTQEMCAIWGSEQTFEYSLRAQGKASKTLSKLHPDILPPEIADEIQEKASLKYIDSEKIRDLEEKKGHDVIAINMCIEDVVSPDARRFVNFLRTSADTTESAKALQLKRSLAVIADSTENLRDIMIEKSLEWKDKPFMDQTHLLDALPSYAGRAFAHYTEMIQSGLKLLRFVYDNSIVGKWGDATGSHHSATTLKIDGMELQREYCKDLGIGCMTAAAQVPGLEFQADILYALTRIGETLNNLANYVAPGKGDDINVFMDTNPKKRKGSGAMPHKDAKGGNPTKEEQFMSQRNRMMGNLVTTVMNCEMPYARNLEASSDMRIVFDEAFKYFDHCIRELAGVMYHLGLNEERSTERVLRTNGIVTSEQVLTYLLDPRNVTSSMPRSEAHDLLGRLSIQSYKSKVPFINVLLQTPEITSRIGKETLCDLANPIKYVGQTREIIEQVARDCYKIKTL